MKDIEVTPKDGNVVVQVFYYGNGAKELLTTLALDKPQAVKIASALMLAAIEPELFSDEKVEEGARMILGE